MSRAGGEHVGVLIADINGVDIQPVQFFPVTHAGGFSEKRGNKVQAFNTQALILNQSCGKNAVKSSGKESKGMIVGHEKPLKGEECRLHTAEWWWSNKEKQGDAFS